MTMSSSEAEIDVIRLALFEETKDLSDEEHTRQSNEHAQQLSIQYGFTIGKPLSKSSRIAV